MLRRVQARNFRCLRDVDVALDGDFHLLVGPNGAGKSAFMDILAFLADFISDGLESAVSIRTDNFQDLVWGRPDGKLAFELAVEIELPNEARELLDEDVWAFRYEVGIDEDEFGIAVAFEQGVLVPGDADAQPRHEAARQTGTLKTAPSDLLRFGRDALDVSFIPEDPVGLKPAGDLESLVLYGRQIDRTAMEAVAWKGGPPETDHVLQSLAAVSRVQLDGRLLRAASPPARRRRERSVAQDGANLPWLVQVLQRDKTTFEAWLAHVRTGLRELEDVRVVVREDDRYAYLMVRYRNGVEVPSWSVSEGTLRLLALTLIAYLPKPPRIYLLEEPENGIHPLAIETAYQSLSSVYDSHVFLASHAPTLLGCAKLDEILCFTTTELGAARVIPGKRHPRLTDWRGAADTHLLFASDVLS